MNPIAIPWYKSPVYVSLLVALLTTISVLFPKVAALLGLVDASSIQTIAEAIMGWIGTTLTAITTIASIIGLIRRHFSQIQPITLTQAKADAKNSSPPTVKESV